MRKSEYPLLEDFLLQAIFIPEGFDGTLSKDITQSDPKLMAAIEDFGNLPDDCALVAVSDGSMLVLVGSERPTNTVTSTPIRPRFPSQLWMTTKSKVSAHRSWNACSPSRKRRAMPELRSRCRKRTTQPTCTKSWASASSATASTKPNGSWSRNSAEFGSWGDM